MNRRPTVRAVAAALGIVALGLGVTGAAVATSGGKGSITACVHKRGGGLYRSNHCARHDGRLTWAATGPRGQAGPQGPAGVKGDTGPQGAPGSARGYAFVGADGTVITKGGSIDISIDKIKTGEYCLKMSPSPGTFAPVLATIQGPDLTPALINVNTSFGSDCNVVSGFGVFTMNPSGKAEDHQFVVAVM